MMTVRAESELRLKETLASIKTTRASWRAMSFNFSLLKEFTSVTDIQKIAFGIITNELSEYEGTIFFMNDDDIIVVGKAITRKDFEAISHEINFHVSEELRLKMMLPLSVLYDLGLSWQELFETACDKLNVAEARRETTGNIRMAAEQDHANTKVSKDILTRRFERSRNCVLIVEDDPLSVFIAKKAVEPDCMTFVAEDGTNACEAYEKYAPDVVFLDIGLPDISGHEVLQKILVIDPTAYVVMLSANSTRSDIMRAMQIGAKGFIGKPFSKSKLLQYIAQAPTYHTI